MGLALKVGILGDLKQNDPEGYDTFASYFANVNTLLSKDR
jgi:hypothetical protein